MISACMHQNVMGISPTLVFNPVYSIKAKQKSKSKKGSAGINTGELGVLTMMKIKLMKQSK
jgi:hypothetical protein